MLQDDDRELLLAALERIQTLEKQVQGSDSMEANPSADDEAEEHPDGADGEGTDDIVTPDGKRVSHIKNDPRYIYRHIYIYTSMLQNVVKDPFWTNGTSIPIYIYIYLYIYAHVRIPACILGYQRWRAAHAAAPPLHGQKVREVRSGPECQGILR